MGRRKEKRNQERLWAGDGKTKRWNRVWERSGKRVSREKGQEAGRPENECGFGARELDSKAIKIL